MPRVLLSRPLRPPRSCSFDHRPETIGLIIAAMTNINAQSAASAYHTLTWTSQENQRNSRIGAETDKSGEERKIRRSGGSFVTSTITPTAAATRSVGKSDIFAHVRPEKGVAEALIELAGMDDEEFDDR